MILSEHENFPKIHLSHISLSHIFLVIPYMFNLHMISNMIVFYICTHEKHLLMFSLTSFFFFVISCMWFLNFFLLVFFRYIVSVSHINDCHMIFFT